MTTHPIPVIQVAGTHRQVGQQIGESMKPQLQRMLARLRESLPPGVSWKDMLLKESLCLTHSRAAYPWYVDELEGVAEAAGLPFEEIFLAICEELGARGLARWPSNIGVGLHRPCRPGAGHRR